MQNLPSPALTPSSQTASATVRFLQTVLLAMLMGGASIVALGSSSHPLDPLWFKVRYGLVGISFVVLSATALMRPNLSTQRRPPLLLWIWLCFGGLALLSGLINENIKALSDGIWFLLGVPILFFYVLPRALAQPMESTMAWGLILGHLPFGIISLVQSPPTTFPYTGIFSNSNQLGVTMLTINGGLLILINQTLISPDFLSKRLQMGGYIALLLASLTLIVFSNSRTSLISSLLGITLAFYPAIQTLKYPRNLVRLLLVGMGLCGAMILYGGQGLLRLGESVELGYTNKLSGAGDLSNGRSFIWGKTWNDARMFGYGSNDYFQQNFDLGGHNSLIDILGQTGYIAFYVMIIIALMSLYYAYCYWREQIHVNPYAMMPLLISLMFWTVSMAESMFGSLGRGLTLAYLLSLGILMYRPLRD
ncbi:MAG: O-antigen ligase family protein [Thermosynechococcaceae cyanobacterium]